MAFTESQTVAGGNSNEQKAPCSQQQSSEQQNRTEDQSDPTKEGKIIHLMLEIWVDISQQNFIMIIYSILLIFSCDVQAPTRSIRPIRSNPPNQL